MTHDILVEAPTVQDLSTAIQVQSADGTVVDHSVWSQACNIVAASTLTSSTVTTPSDHISIDVDLLLVTLRNTDPAPECATAPNTCGDENITFDFELEDFASTVAAADSPTLVNSGPI